MPNPNVIHSNSIPGASTGILMPACTHQFRVRVEGTPLQFSMQAVAFAMNFAKKQLFLSVEQSRGAVTREHIVVQDLIDNPKRVITFEILDPTSNNVIDVIKFHNCVVDDHYLEFDYSHSAAATHNIVFSYDKIDLGNGTASSSAYSNAMSVVGKP